MKYSTFKLLCVGIMNFPRRHLSAVEGHGDSANNQTEQIKNTLNDEHAISAQEHKERFASAPKMLQDTFILQDDGSFLVKMPENSQVMEGHLRDLPIVPGIALKRLFFHQTGIQAKGVTTTQFLGGVFSGETITVKRDGIYKAGKRIVDISVDTKEDIQSPKTESIITYKNMDKSPDDYLLQQNAFRFFSEGEKEGVMKDNTHFRGSFTIPENFTRGENGDINPEILEEIGAQIGAYLTGPDLNKDIPMIHNIEEKTQLNPESKVFTFKLGRSEGTNTQAHTGDTISVTGKVIAFDPNGKEAYFCYIAENNKQEQLIAGEIKGTIIPIKMLIRAYGQIKNSAQK